MSQAVTAFRKFANDNPEVQRELIQITEAAQGFDLTALTALAQRENFNISVQELEAFMAEMADNDELSDFELEMVAAGTPIVCGNTGL
ncbi:MAG: hypothetical protein A2503_05270 [Burkholderiales bacterium RIFOXYD12_FULL_59_19]|nr:MAG: hypothetical protein A2503_05270 [Burkholderiales bacterium RIFOXYD12_FULL_59_19]